MSEFEDRFITQISRYLRSKYEVEMGYVKPASRAREYLMRNGLEEAVNHFISPALRGKIDLKDLEGSRVISSEELIWYENKHNLSTTGVMVLLSEDKSDYVFKKLINYRAHGFAIKDSRLCNFDQNLWLGRTGLIILAHGAPLTIWEHEMTHFDDFAYSLSKATLFLNSKSLSVQSNLELNLAYELISYRHYLKGNIKKTVDILSIDYLREAVIQEIGSRKCKTEKLKEGLAIVKPKIQPAVEAMFYLTKKIKPHLLTPILFALGHDKQAQNCSPLDCIVKLTEAKNRKFLKKVKKELKEKGYL